MLQWGRFVPQSYSSSLKEWTSSLLFVLRLGPSVTIILVKLTAVVGKITQTTWRMVQFMEENSIYAEHFGHLHWL